MSGDAQANRIAELEAEVERLRHEKAPERPTWEMMQNERHLLMRCHIAEDLAATETSRAQRAVTTAERLGKLLDEAAADLSWYANEYHDDSCKVLIPKVRLEHCAANPCRRFRDLAGRIESERSSQSVPSQPHDPGEPSLAAQYPGTAPTLRLQLWERDQRIEQLEGEVEQWTSDCNSHLSTIQNLTEEADTLGKLLDEAVTLVTAQRDRTHAGMTFTASSPCQCATCDVIARIEQERSHGL